MKRPPFLTACSAALVALLVALPAHALYKVVGPDGKVTYTDVPPPAGGNARPVDARPNAAPPVALPYELRQAVSRYPVTLYTSADCGPCESGRRWLRERGVPFTERTISTNEELKLLGQTVGGSELPAMKIGAQPVQGYEPGQWASLFDVAGYPKTSQLPRNYQYAAATPLIAPPPPPAASAPAPAPTAPLPTPPAITPDNPTGIRF